jgi:uncharacterized protein with beta-barrel porin domain
VRFAGAAMPSQPTADIWGNRIGRDYVNLGLGADWKLSGRDNISFYLKYDAKVYKRATAHSGEVGFMIKW